MKKAATILLCLVIVSGCWTVPGVIKGISILGGKVETVLCDPTVDQVADAISALAFLQQNPAIAVALGGAISVFLNIRDKICVTIPQLQAALTKFDAAVGAAMLRAYPGGQPVPKLKALRKAAK